MKRIIVNTDEIDTISKKIMDLLDEEDLSPNEIKLVLFSVESCIDQILMMKYMMELFNRKMGGDGKEAI